ncbi:MAG: MFS transporter [Bacillota bacterium]|nr:MFS transporter [Bacillota bacterium]
MTKVQKKPNFVLIMIIYLAGIFMGAIDTGIVTPARTIIQNNLGVDATSGIWMITIYTLAYAASIPVMGKLADRYGRKYVYLISISLFGLGSLFCGLSQNFGGFTLLLIARSVQAIGGGGILPVATAEFGTTFPPEKRGMALGLVGGVYGIANIFGASAGSAILDLFGKNNWQFIFYLNVPITLFIVIAGFLTLRNGKSEIIGKIDGFGISVLVVMILSLLYGLKNLDYFNFVGTIGTKTVYPFLILFAVLIPVFILIERKAQDPVMNLKYFTNKNIIFTLLLSFVSGFVMMGMIFVPQFSENALKIASGSGGYLVIILGVFAGISAPVSGKIIDKFGAKVVLGFGFAISIIGSVFLILFATTIPNFTTVFISLMFIGIGVGFTMGTPINYMMLANTDERESNSSLATISLVRSIGTAIAPAIMIGFIAHAGASVQTNITSIMPNEVKVPQLPYSQEINDKINKLKTDPNTKDKIGNIDIPDLTSMQTVKINMNDNSKYKLPADLIELMQSSDVTTITANSKTFASRMFAEMTPDIIKNIQDGVSKGINGIGSGISSMKDSSAQIQKGYNGISQGVSGMTTAVSAQKSALTQLQSVSDMFTKMGNGELPSGMTIADMIPANVKAKMPQSAVSELAKLKSEKDLNAKINDLNSSISTLESKITKATTGKNNMSTAIDGMNSAVSAQKSALAQLQSIAGMLEQMGIDELPPGKTIADMIPANIKANMAQSVIDELSNLKSIDDLNAKINELNSSISTLEAKISALNTNKNNITTAINGMNSAVSAQKSALAQLQNVAKMFKEMGSGQLPSGMTIADMIPANVKANMPQSAVSELAKLKSAKDLNAKINELNSSISTLESKISAANTNKSNINSAIDAINSSISKMEDLKSKMIKMNAAVPAAFETAKNNYLLSVNDKSSKIENVFQTTLNEGFKNVYLSAAIASAIALLLLAFYSKKRENLFSLTDENQQKK